ncbi:MAG TPA: hypothetical protein VHP58_01865 [Alphaproteobacteria bacterium]|nr:hypothetical protein [Alphaproteobacteria bacterium]
MDHRPRPQLPAIITMYPKIARVPYTRGQQAVFDRIDGLIGKPRLGLHLLAALELCRSVIEAYDRGSLVALTSPDSGDEPVELYPLRVHELVPYGQATFSMTRTYADRLLDMGPHFRLKTVDDLMCTVWDNYLNIMRRIMPPNTKPTRGLVELYDPTGYDPAHGAPADKIRLIPIKTLGG